MRLALVSRRDGRYISSVPHDFARFPGEDARQYLISEGQRLVASFLTCEESGDGLSAHEVAIANLIAYSKHRAGTYTVTWLPPEGEPVDLAVAENNVGTLLQDQDAIAADSMFGRQLLTPAQRARAAWNVRNGVEGHTMWGEAS